MKTHGLVREITISIAIVAAVVLGCMIYLWGPALYFWVLAPREQYKVLVPEGYEGPVLIAWQIPDGEIAKREGGSWIYQLGADGALLLRSDAPSTLTDTSFWYTMENGDLEPLPLNRCFEDSVASQPVVCTGGTAAIYKTRELHPNQRFHITSTPKRSEWSTSENYSKLLDRYFNQLVIDSN